MSDTTTALLQSIDATLKAILAVYVTVPGSTVASDADLDGKYGDPTIKKKDPRDWTGEPMSGRRFSECPAEYLELFAEREDYFAGKADETGEVATNGKPKSVYHRLDASRARGWARRIRAGYKAPAAAGWRNDDDGI